MFFLTEFKQAIATTLSQKTQIEFQALDISLNTSDKFQTFDLTWTAFALLKHKITLETLNETVKEALGDSIDSVEAIKGFLNIKLSAKGMSRALDDLETISLTEKSISFSQNRKILLEYCGPNTNKPLHIGHLRNIFLARSLSHCLRFSGNEVHEVTIFNDRGIAICKSMVAYHLFGNGQTPESLDIKPDKYVGDLYVKISQTLKEQTQVLIQQGVSPKEAEDQTPIMKLAREFLLKWEDGDKVIKALWEQMNHWFYSGFDKTLETLEIDFERKYYESQIYLQGKDIAQEGLNKGVFDQNEDGSISIDLTEEGLDIKTILRKDGTSLYITQDMALAQNRFEDFAMDTLIYVVGEEQEYHFKVLKHILLKLDYPFAPNIYHLSYGLVVGSDGSKFKSREGTAVDADDIIDSVVEQAYLQAKSTEKNASLSENELRTIANQVALASIKFMMLKVYAKKKIVFDPKETVDIHGDTGGFILYSLVRAKSILAKNELAVITDFAVSELYELSEVRALVLHMTSFEEILFKTISEHNPSEMALYSLNLAKLFNKFYQVYPIRDNSSEIGRNFGLYLVSRYVLMMEKCLYCLDIKPAERM
ncbi:MAG: arginine--tRNA ligase [Chitinophagales bacterium]|jgi:arginyl-tRNA synthetase|nr:arginine--tRNA ligase [Chitinophagales bacterium]